MTTNVLGVDRVVDVAGSQLHVLEGGQGKPVLVLHRDTGSPGWQPFHEVLAQGRTVFAPGYPGFGMSEPIEWLAGVKELAVLQLSVVRRLHAGPLPVVGLGFGGWLAAEMASMCPELISQLVLVSPMGLRPREGEIVDQFLMDPEDYVGLGFGSRDRFIQLFGEQPSAQQMEVWEESRESLARLGWKPYMYDPSLSPMLLDVRVPTLIVTAADDRVVPADVARQYAEALPEARTVELAGGHYLDVEQPELLAHAVTEFIG